MRVEDLTNGPQFLIMSREDADPTLNLNSVSSFVIDRAVRGCAGEVKSIYRQRNGTLLIETRTKTQASKLKKFNEIYGPIKIKVIEHPTLNLCKGIVSCFDFTFSTNEQMLEELSSQGVVNVNIIKKRLPNSEKPTFRNTSYAILTFKLCRIPERIKMGFYSTKVKQYIPNPLRCFKCQKFGHAAERCINEKLCGKCGHKNHNPEECTNPAQCSNCKDAHPAWSRQCDIFREEYEVQKIKVTNKTTYRIARREYIKINPSAKINNRQQNRTTFSNILTNTQPTTKHHEDNQIDETNRKLTVLQNKEVSEKNQQIEVSTKNQQITTTNAQQKTNEMEVTTFIPEVTIQAVNTIPQTINLDIDESMESSGSEFLGFTSPDENENIN